jgi:hypothetical protein
MIRNPVDRFRLEEQSEAAVDSRLRGNDGYAGSKVVGVVLAKEFVRHSK